MSNKRCRFETDYGTDSRVWVRQLSICRWRNDIPRYGSILEVLQREFERRRRVDREVKFVFTFVRELCKNDPECLFHSGGTIRLYDYISHDNRRMQPFPRENGAAYQNEKTPRCISALVVDEQDTREYFVFYIKDQCPYITDVRFVPTIPHDIEGALAARARRRTAECIVTLAPLRVSSE